MCGTCGCGVTVEGTGISDATAHEHAAYHANEQRRLVLEQQLLHKNDTLAGANRAWFQEQNVLAVNVMGGPGAGKTALLERVIGQVQTERPVAVLEGDQETDRDAERIRAVGCKVHQINTGAGCHLDAHMIQHACAHLSLAPGTLLLIENVGNLVCPSLFDLGERLKVVVMSCTEGDDKPQKYPHMFRAADVFVLNKVDLLPHVSFDVERCLEDAARVNPRLRVVQTSATRGDGIQALLAELTVVQGAT